ncbi:MAG: peptidase domain-containing ABC transporter [Pseudomonadota bacterium]
MTDKGQMTGNGEERAQASRGAARLGEIELVKAPAGAVADASAPSAAPRRGRRRRIEKSADAARAPGAADGAAAGVAAGADFAAAALTASPPLDAPAREGAATASLESDAARPTETEGEAGPTSVRRIVRKAAWGTMGQLIAMSIVINLLALAAPLFVLQVYDRVVPHDGMTTLVGLMIGVVGVLAFDFILKQSRSRLVQLVALRVDVSLSRALFRRITGLPLKALERRQDAEWRMLMRDAEAVRDTTAGPTVALLVDLPFAVIFVAVIAFAAPPLAGVLLALLPVYILLAALSSAVITRAARAEHGAARGHSSLVGELVAGRETVKALGLGPHLMSRWEDGQADVIDRSLARGAHTDAFANLAATTAVLTTVLLTSVGAAAIIDLQLTMGALIAANMLAARIVQPLSQLINLWRAFDRYREAAARLDEVLAASPELERSALARPRPEGVIALEKVEFTYPDAERPALEKVTLTARPGAMVGVIGVNGCGKTTLLKVMQGLYAPEGGRVLLDGADMAQFGRAELTRWIGYAPQEAFLFEGSVRENIAKGRPEISDEAVLRAARLAGADGFIASLPEGFGASVGEGGRRFSPGQRQRLALARALVDDPAALLLDEPSANLDTEAERALIETLTALKATRSVVVVSHSRPLLEACDTIVAMHEGRIAMIGRAEEMMARRAPLSRGAAPGRGRAAREDRQAEPEDGAAPAAARGGASA